MRADLCRLGAVEVEAGGEEDELGAALARLEAGHGGVDAEFARLVVAGGDDAAPRAAADGDGLAGEFGTLAHLHGGVEAVHVEMDDLAHRFKAMIRDFASRRNSISQAKIDQSAGKPAG